MKPCEAWLSMFKKCFEDCVWHIDGSLYISLIIVEIYIQLTQKINKSILYVFA